MVCRHCISALRNGLESLGLDVLDAGLGFAEIAGDEPDAATLAQIDAKLATLGFKRITDADDALVERIRQAILHHVRDENECRLNLSACIEKHVGVGYDTASRIFSQRQGRTIEKFHIAQKVERVKELLADGELSLTEIAFRTGYSSVAHLSRQFKDVTGMTPSAYAKSGLGRNPINEL